MRCASVAGVTRNTRAISSVVRPQISRRVSDLSLRRQSGIAAGEDQTEAIVLDLFISGLFISAGSVVDARFYVGYKISLCHVEARAPTDHVDGLEACR